MYGCPYEQFTSPAKQGCQNYSGHSSSLGWLALEQHMLFHRCMCVYKCVSNITSNSMVLPANRDVHNYNTQRRDNLRLPRVARRGGLMVSALDSGSGGPGSSRGRGTALCSWARYFTLIVPLSTQVYKWVPANLLLGVTLRWTPSRFMLRKPG